jgi:hypothetical protein
MGASEENDASFQNNPPRDIESKEKEQSPTSPHDKEIHSEKSGASSNPREQIRGIRGTGIFTVPDPLDPSTRAKREDDIRHNYSDIEFNGKCGHCGRAMNPDRPEARCTVCGMILHQFCFDGHVVKMHRPKGVSVVILLKDGKYFARVKKSDE